LCQSQPQPQWQKREQDISSSTPTRHGTLCRLLLCDEDIDSIVQELSETGGRPEQRGSWPSYGFWSSNAPNDGCWRSTHLLMCASLLRTGSTKAPSSRFSSGVRNLLMKSLMKPYPDSPCIRIASAQIADAAPPMRFIRCQGHCNLNLSSLEYDGRYLWRKESSPQRFPAL
jgi:hypothetical protein